MPSNLISIENWNPNYTISIFGTDELGKKIGSGIGNGRFGILSPMPEEFNLETTSNWHPLLEGILRSAAGALAGRRGEDAVDTILPLLQSAGYSTISKYQTQQLWQSTSPISFNLPLRFNAISDVVKDVTNPILQLLALTLPSEVAHTAGQILRAPGPTLIDSNYQVHVAIGRMFLFNNIIVKNVSTNFTALPAASGDFIYADVNLNIETSTILTKTDFQAAYLGGADPYAVVAAEAAQAAP